MDQAISLLPFIGSQASGFHLDLCVSGTESDPGQGSPFPFQIADTGKNFSILVKGGLRVKDSPVFQPLFLLTQRDDYPVPPGDLTFQTNADLDRIWIKTIRFYDLDKAAFYIPGPGENTPRPFHSLFYCTKEKKFFEPPCPQCGDPLLLCRDDGRLKESGLFPYHASLRRYLYCPRCHGAGQGSLFYQFSRSPEDRVHVRDRFDLIRDFGKLRSRASGNFPCLDCPGHAECYVLGEKAGSRIRFFSFYPFYMLFLPAASINAVDFIPLLSGASPEQAGFLPMTAQGAEFMDRLGRYRGPWFFFDQDPRFFLEVLYLKLTFLEQFILCLILRTDIPTGLCARSIWINSGADTAMMPFFWNFSLTIIDLVSEPLAGRDLFTGNRNLEFMVRLWFHTFLSNRQQSPNEVFQIAGALSGRPPDPSLDAQALIHQFPGLAPDNIFWEPRHLSLPGQWHLLWFKTLFSGLCLLNKDHGSDLSSCLTGLVSDIKVLKQEIQTELFSTRPWAPAAVHPSPRQAGEKTAEPAGHTGPSLREKQAIAKMLGSLRAKWAKASAAPGPDGEEDVLETIVLSSGKDGPEQIRAEEPDSREPAPRFDDFYEKTVILQGAGEPGEFEDMEKTVILSPSTKLSGPSEPETGCFGEDDDLDKTLIIPPRK